MIIQYIDYLLQAAEIIHWSKLNQRVLQYKRWRLFFTRNFRECYLTSRSPPVLLNNDGHMLKTLVCWFVIRTDKLNSSVQVCLAGSLHDYLTLLQAHNSLFIVMMRFLISNQAYSLFLYKKWWEHSDIKPSLPCISGHLQCNFFLVSHVSTVKYIRWMIFNSYPLLVVLCNTLETMQ